MAVFASGSFIFNPMGITGVLWAGLALLLLFEGATLFLKSWAGKAETYRQKEP
jgi:hypothetical protein